MVIHYVMTGLSVYSASVFIDLAIHFIKTTLVIIQDYSEPETSAKRVTEGDLFLYNQSPVSGSKGMACIAMAVVDGDGNLVHHQHYPKPYPFTHLEALNCREFASLTLTKLYEARDSSLDCGPGEYLHPLLQNALRLAKHVTTYIYVLWHVMYNSNRT
jgi:hypothetical protein